MPTIGQVLPRKLEPESSIATGDQGAWHIFVSCRQYRVALL
jgi:hypothetical protein